MMIMVRIIEPNLVVSLFLSFCSRKGKEEENSESTQEEVFGSNMELGENSRGVFSLEG